MTMPDAIAETRRDLAAAFRWAERQGYHEGICNHFSAVVPGADDRFLINAHGWHWSEITASSLVELDSSGRVIAGPDDGNRAVEPTVLYIHWCVHSAHPRAKCVLHTHMPFATALTSLVDKRLRMANQNAIRFQGRIAHDEA